MRKRQIAPWFRGPLSWLRPWGASFLGCSSSQLGPRKPPALGLAPLRGEGAPGGCAAGFPWGSEPVLHGEVRCPPSLRL